MKSIAKPKRKRAKVTNIRMAGTGHAVVSLTGGGAGHRVEPCGGCPWRKDQTGLFPAEAFKHSASTSYDAAFNTFACHESGSEKPATCAGFLLNGSEHNLAIRIKRADGLIREVTDGGHELHESYRAMAIANGVDPDDPVLQACRP